MFLLVKEGFVAWRRLLLPTKREVFDDVFALQGVPKLPPPAILDIMLAIDYPDWPKMCRALAKFWSAVPPARGRFFVPIYDLIETPRVLSQVLWVLQEQSTPEEHAHHLLRTCHSNIKELEERHGRATLCGLFSCSMQFLQLWITSLHIYVLSGSI